MCVDTNAISKKPPLVIAQDTQKCTEHPTQIRVAFEERERNYLYNSYSLSHSDNDQGQAKTKQGRNVAVNFYCLEIELIILSE